MNILRYLQNQFIIGINPEELRGKRCGVFVGTCFSESEKTWFYEKINVNGFGITGCSRTMLANRISYWLGVNGWCINSIDVLKSRIIFFL